MDKFSRFYGGIFKLKHKLWNVCDHYICQREIGQTQPSAILNILFFGNDDFAKRSLKALNTARNESNVIKNIDVVTSYKMVNNPVEKYARQHNLKLHDAITKDEIVDNQYDLGIVVSYGQLIPEEIINAFPHGMINAHGSLLPKWRGAAPIIHAILNGDRTTGISIMKIRPKRFDIGEILVQEQIDIPENVLMPQLRKSMAVMAGKLLVKCVHNLERYLEQAKPQSKDVATHAPRVTMSTATINWAEMSAETIRRRYRALYSLYPLYTTFNDRIVKIHKLELDLTLDNSRSSPKPPGFVEFIWSNKHLKVHCLNGEYLIVSELAMEGKKIMNAIEFTNGFVKKLDVNKRYFV